MIKEILNKRNNIVFEIDKNLYIKASKLLSQIERPFSLENVFFFFSCVLSKLEEGCIFYSHQKLKDSDPLTKEYNFYDLLDLRKRVNFSGTEKIKVKFGGVNSEYSKKNLKKDVLKFSGLLNVSADYNLFAETAIAFYILFLEAFSRIDSLSLDVSFYLVNESDRKKETAILKRKDLFNFS